MGRAPCCEKVGLKKGPWTPEEDHKLIAYVNEHGHGSWRTLPKKAGLLRCGKSCRLRWTNYLRPDIKRGKFSLTEEQLIIHLHALLGNRWSAIASHLPKRTDNEIKNFWNTHLKKRLLKLGIDPISHKPMPMPMPMLPALGHMQPEWLPMGAHYLQTSFRSPATLPHHVARFCTTPMEPPALETPPLCGYMEPESDKTPPHFGYTEPQTDLPCNMLLSPQEDEDDEEEDEEDDEELFWAFRGLPDVALSSPPTRSHNMSYYNDACTDGSQCSSSSQSLPLDLAILDPLSEEYAVEPKLDLEQLFLSSFPSSSIICSSSPPASTISTLDNPTQEDLYLATMLRQLVH